MGHQPKNQKLHRITPKDKQNRFQGVLSVLKVLSPEGVKLLEINADLDLMSLKKHYKNAAKKHHPDFGGSVENMQIINNAFSLFHDTILNFKPSSPTDLKVFNAKSLSEFYFAIRIVLSSIYGDVYAADN